jgi:2-amino-4-hydroxy-6-hydroxymethyldihydropteridine diphosphokinase
MADKSMADKSMADKFMADKFMADKFMADKFMAKSLIALGGNVGDVRATFDQAIAKLCSDDAVRLIARSSDYRTAPWGLTEQAPFVNAVIAVATTLAPHDLLARAQASERALGRNRAAESRWGPRTIDIDLLTYDDLVLADHDLILPHPLMLERAFVLVPLSEVAPDRLIAGVKVVDALKRVDAGGIEKLPPR